MYRATALMIIKHGSPQIKLVLFSALFFAAVNPLGQATKKSPAPLFLLHFQLSGEKEAVVKFGVILW